MLPDRGPLTSPFHSVEADIFRPEYQVERHPGIFEYPGILPIDELFDVYSGTTPVLVESDGTYGFHWTPGYNVRPHSALFYVAQMDPSWPTFAGIVLPDELGRTHDLQFDENLKTQHIPPLTLVNHPGRYLFVYAEADQLSVCFTPQERAARVSNSSLLRGLELINSPLSFVRPSLAKELRTDVGISPDQLKDLNKTFGDRDTRGIRQNGGFNPRISR